MRQKERYPAARRKIDSGGRKCDEKMTEEAEQRRWKLALEGARAQHAGGDPLQDLLESNGDSTRSMSAAKSPGEWSIERATFRSAPKK